MLGKDFFDSIRRPALDSSTVRSGVETFVTKATSVANEFVGHSLKFGSKTATDLVNSGHVEDFSESIVIGDSYKSDTSNENIIDVLFIVMFWIIGVIIVIGVCFIIFWIVFK